MAVDLTGAMFGFQLSFQQANADPNFPLTISKSLKWQQAYTKGTAAAMIKRLAIMQFTIAASGTLAIDVNAGTFSGGTFAGGGSNIVDLLGEAINFTAIKGLAIQLLDVASGSTGVHMNPAASNALDATLGGKVRAAGTNAGQLGGLCWWDPTAGGITVDGTHKIISIVNDDSSHAATVNVAIAGLP